MEVFTIIFCVTKDFCMICFHSYHTTIISLKDDILVKAEVHVVIDEVNHI